MKLIRRLEASFLLFGFLLLIGCKENQAKPNTVYVTNTLFVEHTNIVTIEHTNRLFVTNEVYVEPKIVPAEIPKLYIDAADFQLKYISAHSAIKNELFKGVKAINVVVIFTENLTSAAPSRFRLMENEIRNSIELDLRKNGIRVKPEAAPLLIFLCEGIWNSNSNIFSSTVSVEFELDARFERPESEFIHKVVPVWNNVTFGLAGLTKVNEQLRDQTSALVTEFSNLYLEANPK